MMDERREHTMHYDVMADYLGEHGEANMYAMELAKFAPTPPPDDYIDDGIIYTLRDRHEALAMRERLIAAGAINVRVYEVPNYYEETGGEDWIPSDDGLTLVIKPPLP